MDRNIRRCLYGCYSLRSLSARRAWIEITVVATLATLVTVALRKESVDRNLKLLAMLILVHSRSPQGERG